MKLLLRSLIVDRHNDLAWQYRVYFMNQLDKVDLTQNTSGADPKIYGNEWQTDIPRLRAGKVGGQVWATYYCQHVLGESQAYRVVNGKAYCHSIYLSTMHAITDQHHTTAHLVSVCVQSSQSATVSLNVKLIVH